VPRRHASYQDLAADPGVDVVYVATPHPFHKENSILCMEAGKAVLCEKPIGINAGEAEEMIACARANGVFLMEAMWTRFLPAIVRLRDMVAEDLLGDVRMVKADFCFRSNGDPQGRLLNPDLGGGSLLDVGIYPIALSYMVFGGPPVEITSLAHLGETGVDEQAGMVLRFEGDRLAVLTCGIEAAMPHEALVVGTDKWVKVHSPFWKTQGLTLGSGADAEQVMELPYAGNGYECEARHVMECLRAGKTDSDVMPLAESLAIMQTMDELRAAWGLRYPME
jgi:predicted dehydrogenase